MGWGDRVHRFGIVLSIPGLGPGALERHFGDLRSLNVDGCSFFAQLEIQSTTANEMVVGLIKITMLCE